MRHHLRLLVAGLAVVVTVWVMLALPYTLTEAYGLKAKRSVSLMRLVVIAVFSAGLVFFWIVRYRQTSHDLDMLQAEIERKRRRVRSLEHNESGK